MLIEMNSNTTIENTHLNFANIGWKARESKFFLDLHKVRIETLWKIFGIMAR
jgi:hypothetical protein